MGIVVMHPVNPTVQPIVIRINEFKRLFIFFVFMVFMYFLGRNFSFHFEFTDGE